MENLIDRYLTTLTSKDVELLDFILKSSLDKGIVHPNDLPPLSSTFLAKAVQVKATEYSYYLDILTAFEVVVIDKDLSGFHIKPIHIRTRNFYDQGGFKALFDKKQFEINQNKEIEDIRYKKLKWDSRLSKWQVKTFWWIFGLACFGGIYSLYDIVFNKIASNTEPYVTVSHMEEELSKIRTLILENQAFDIDSVSKPKNDNIPEQ